MEPELGPRLWDLPYEQRVEVVRNEIERITGRLGELDPAPLDRPAIGDWAIRDVIAHLVVVAEFYADNIRRGALGDGGPTGDWVPAGSGRGEASAAGIAQTAGKVALALGPTPVEKLYESAMGLAAALDAGESSLEYECYHPGGILPANRFAVLFLKELGLHEWDIFEALEPPCEMGRWGIDAATQAMEEELASGSLRWLTDPDPNPDALILRVRLSGDLVLERDLLLEQERTRLVPVDQERAVDSQLSIGAADFVLACSGRRELRDLVTEGRGEGDPDALAIVDRRLTGM